MVPSCVKVASLPAGPKLRIAESLNNLRSLPITASRVTERPPSVWREPSVIDVASFVLFTFNFPAIVVNEFDPAAIVTSNSPFASPSSIINPAVLKPSCSATLIVNLPPSCPFVATLTCDIISEKVVSSWLASSPINCIIPLKSSLAPGAPLSLTN